MRHQIATCLFVIIFTMCACSSSNHTDPLFTSIPSTKSNVNFINKVENTQDFNIFSYRNFYNGGGVGLGDINNDGLLDIYLTSNMGSNKLYLNKGDFVFEDITDIAGVAEDQKWSTGVVFVDINNDSLMDIYVCNAGYRKGSDQSNSLFINNGDDTFYEDATSYGLDDRGYTTHAAFFDYDRDGDLDVYLLNNSFIPVNTLNYSNKRELRAQDWPVKDFLKGGGDKLLRNDDGKFVDVSEKAGIYGSLIGFGLGVNVADLNNDGWVDIYVCNDFFERDYYYINNKKGGFDEGLENHFDHISLSSMGADIGDINNDGALDVFVTDMLPGDLERLQRTATFENIDVNKLKKERGFYNQYMQNTLQLNTGTGNFQEIAYHAGVASSDWSWGALMFDADGNMLSDLFISNGIYHDVIDQDFIDFFANDIIQKMTLSGEKEELDSIINKMPSTAIPNKLFLNQGDLKFEEKGLSEGLDDHTFSNGAAYGDLDNDGDLDLVINNVNQQAIIYRNNSKTNFLKVRLHGDKNNVNAIGAEVYCYVQGQVLSRVNNPSRGFQSSVDQTVHFGLADHEHVDSIAVKWSDGTTSIHYAEMVNQTIDLEKDNALNLQVDSFITLGYFSEIKTSIKSHKEDDFTDFYFERNLSQITSREGPATAVGDVNGDSKDDVIISGAAGFATELYISTKEGFLLSEQPALIQDAKYEDVAMALLDVDGDNDLDLYVGGGGNNKPVFSGALNDRLYLNDGSGNFMRDPYALPGSGMNTGVVAPHDFDGDGDQDIFVGSRSIPGNYGISPVSYFLENKDGKFTDIAKSLNPELSQPGLITDAMWVDLVGDEGMELLMVGDWMEPKMFSYDGTEFKKITTSFSTMKGWWSHANYVDIDNDGDQDLILGNRGSNFYLQPKEDHPAKLWLGDFTGDGSFETVLTQDHGGKDIPVASKRDLTEQFSFLKKKNLKHSEFAGKSIQEIFGKEVMKKASVKSVNYTSSVIAINKGSGVFEIKELPSAAQLSSINTSVTLDVNMDGYKDVLLAGNNYGYLPQFSRQDAGEGLLLLNDGSGVLQTVMDHKLGVRLKGEVRDMKVIDSLIIIGINNDQPHLLKLNLRNEAL